MGKSRKVLLLIKLSMTAAKYDTDYTRARHLATATRENHCSELFYAEEFIFRSWSDEVLFICSRKQGSDKELISHQYTAQSLEMSLSARN